MLDFKIKELKRQIEPRETEIGSMKEQIKEMDRELEQVSSTPSCLSVQPAYGRNLPLAYMLGEILAPSIGGGVKVHFLLNLILRVSAFVSLAEGLCHTSKYSPVLFRLKRC